MNTKIICAVRTVALLCLLFSVVISAQPLQAQVAESRSESRAYGADSETTVEFQVRMSADEISVGAFTLKVDYDDSVLSLTGCRLNDDALTGICNAAQNPVMASGVAPAGISGDFVVLSLTFDVRADASVSDPIGVVSVDTLANIAGSNITDYSINDGVVTIHSAGELPAAAAPEPIQETVQTTFDEEPSAQLGTPIMVEDSVDASMAGTEVVQKLLLPLFAR